MDSDDIKVRLELLGEISESELIFPVGARRAPERSREQLSEHCLSAWRRRRSRELRPLSRIHALRGIRTSCTAQSRLREERREPRAERPGSVSLGTLLSRQDNFAGSKIGRTLVRPKGPRQDRRGSKYLARGARPAIIAVKPRVARPQNTSVSSDAFAGRVRWITPYRANPPYKRDNLERIAEAYEMPIAESRFQPELN